MPAKCSHSVPLYCNIKIIHKVEFWDVALCHWIRIHLGSFNPSDEATTATNYPVLQHCILEGKPLLHCESLKPYIIYELTTVCEKQFLYRVGRCR